MAAGEAVVDMAWVEVVEVVEELPRLGRACMTTCHSQTHLGVAEVLARRTRRMLNTHHQRTPRQDLRMLESLVQITVAEDVADDVAETEDSTPMTDEPAATNV
jgi:hypothetical protein